MAKTKPNWIFAGLAAPVLLPVLVQAVMAFAPLPETWIVTQAAAFASMIPGLGKSHARLLAYRSEFDAARVVVIAFWGFVGNTVLAGGLVFLLVRHATPASGGTAAKPQRPHVFDWAMMIAILTLLLFLFADPSLSPTDLTPATKAYGASIAGAQLVAIVWGYSFLLSLVFLGWSGAKALERS